jgi:hypothetical protein
MSRIIALEGPGVTAESYGGHGRLGRMRPLPSAQIVTFVVDPSGETGDSSRPASIEAAAVAGSESAPESDAPPAG